MSLEHLRPFAEQHAVQSAVFAMEFSAPLDVGEIARLRSAAAALLKGDFARIVEQHRMAVHLGAAPEGQPPTATAQNGGFVLERAAASSALGASPSRVVLVSPESVVIVVNDYTRWERFSADVWKYLGVILASVNAQKGVSSINLQVSDAFIWDADPDEFIISEVISPSSPFLVGNIFSSAPNMLWHVHHGYIVDRELPIKYSELNNINVARTVMNSSHALTVLASHKASFHRPLYKFLDANQGKIASALEALHMRNKEVLAELLTLDVQAMINLNGRGK